MTQKPIIDIYLSDEKLKQAWVDEWRVPYDEPPPTNDAGLRAIGKVAARHAVKQVIKWLDSPCPHEKFRPKISCPLCCEALEALKELVKE